MDDLKVSRSSYLNRLSINIVSYLEEKTGVCQVKNEVKTPAERPAILMWEQKNSLLLPEDLKSFYLTSNGFHLTWSVKLENMTVPVGSMHINHVGKLTRLESGTLEGTHVQPSLWDLNLDTEISGKKAPSFVDSRIFELDPCDGFGKVCLVYNEVEQDFVTEIWFLDRSLQWHFMCDTFLAYFRLMLMHLGLPQWQYAFTDIGLPSSVRQWFNLFSPIRLEVDMEGLFDHAGHPEMNSPLNSSPLELNKIFKGKNDRKKVIGSQSSGSTPTASATTKRKVPVASARSATAMGKLSGSQNAQAPVKTSR